MKRLIAIGVSSPCPFQHTINQKFASRDPEWHPLPDPSNTEDERPKDAEDRAAWGSDI